MSVDGDCDIPCKKQQLCEGHCAGIFPVPAPTEFHGLMCQCESLAYFQVSAVVNSLFLRCGGVVRHVVPCYVQCKLSRVTCDVYGHVMRNVNSVMMLLAM